MNAHQVGFKVVQRKDWEQVVACELLIPNVPNSYGDIYTPEAILEFLLMFQEEAGIDVNHNQVDVAGEDAEIIDMFIADETTPEFICGSLVVVTHIIDPDLWQKVLDGEINGYSYEATCEMTEISITNLANREVFGTTEPDPEDGHTHDFLVVLDPLNRPIAGGTGFTNSHAHTITTHTVTDDSNGHNHRYQVIVVPEDNDA